MAITGVTGQPWRADVTPWGAVVPWDGSATLDWHVAADDRWHTPAGEPSVRQRRVDGTAAFETRLRVPDGDVVQRIWSVADHGGLTIVSFDNESPLPVAVALTRRNLLTSRPPAEVPIEGIDLPADSTIVLPVGHRASVSVALAHTGGSAGQLPPALPSFEQVARGWTRLLEQSSRLLVPDGGTVEAIAAIRCDLLLGGPPAVVDDAAGAALAIGEIVRLGEPPDAWIEEVADAVELIGAEQGWDVEAALAAAALVLQRAGEHRAVADVERIASGRTPVTGRPMPAPTICASWHGSSAASPAARRSSRTGSRWHGSGATSRCTTCPLVRRPRSLSPCAGMVHARRSSGNSPVRCRFSRLRPSTRRGRPPIRQAKPSGPHRHPSRRRDQPCVG